MADNQARSSDLAPVNPPYLGPQASDRNLRLRSVAAQDDVEVDSFGQLRAVWDLLFKHQWLILATTVILTVLVAIASFKEKPVYRATGRIVVEAETPLLQSLNELFRTVEADASFLETQVSILQSDNLAWETIQQLGLDKKDTNPSATQSQTVAISPDEKNRIIAGFKSGLRVERTKETRMVTVSYEATDPRHAAEVVNAQIKNYIENNFRTKYDATRQATGWMEQRLDELKLKVEKSEQAMMTYERQNNLVNLGEKQTLTEARFEDMSRHYSEAQSERLTKEALYKMVASDDTQVGFIQGNSLLANLEQKEASLKEQYSEAIAQYGPTYPKALRLQDQIKDEDSLIAGERKRIVENVHNDYLSALQRERYFATVVAEQKKDVERVNQLLIEDNLLKRDFESNQQLYDGLLQHLKDANVSAGLRATNIHVIDDAPVPSYPVRPNKTRNIEFALAAGLVLGVTLAFTKEALDNSIKNAQEMEKLTGLSTLAIVPMGRASVRTRSGLMLDEGAKGNGGYDVELAVLTRPGAAISEAFRALRTSVLLSTAERPPQAVLITSSQPSEGKTSTALNLAATLAQKGSRVLLLDADLRRPGLARALDLPNARGLSGLLTGAHEYENSLLQQVHGAEHLYLLSTGPRPPNPAELLCSMKMEKLLLRLRQDFDHVIIDSPPILPLTDATILSTLVDGVIMIVECEATSRAALNRACRVMAHSGGKILGTVFNKVDARRDGYYGYRLYHGYYNYYSHYYEQDDDQPAA